MNSLRALVLITTIAALALTARSAPPADFRPPAVPLITSDPYLSIWSEADHLNDDVTRHWTHHPHSLISLIRVDGKPFRLMGAEPKSVAPFPQQGLEVLPTRSIYQFDDGHVHVTMTFMQPALPHDIDVLTRPISYITWSVRSTDGAQHAVQIYDSTSSELAVMTTNQKVEWGKKSMGPLSAMFVGTQEQPILGRMGDDTRIDWGYAYAAADASQSKSAIGDNDKLLDGFVADGSLPAADDAQMPRAVKDGQPVLAFTFDLGKVGAEAVSRHVTIAYDEIFSIRYFLKNLRPYWRRNGAMPADLLETSEKEYPALVERCEAFDKDLMADLTKAGGADYAKIAALAYRQSLCACGYAADANKQLLLFTKENTSNGDIATVDVIFPMEPILLLLSPTLTKASLVSVLDYSASSHWKFPNAPHDLGTYPIVMGRDDGGEGMPVEESGNMLILCDALAQSEGNTHFSDKYWPQLTQWAKYLEAYGLDPENQLCTDDFMGHLAHNANLSIKAILGLAAYGDMCRIRGDMQNAKKYADLAKADAEHWMKTADDGDHSLLAFDKPGTWSQKYNLVWDRILGLNVFPPEVAAKEIAFYKNHLQQYGVPLDSRTKLTKTDWSVWSASMATNPQDFQALIAPIYDYLDHTSARSPLVDSYMTNNIKSDGMHARPVVGGIFIKMLTEPAIWKKWSSGDREKIGEWAPLPKPPVVTEIVPTSRNAPTEWRYTEQKPPADWTKVGFDDSSWKKANGPFGSRGTPGIKPKTQWKSDDIWLRREFVMPENPGNNLQFVVYHDEDVEIYINGILGGTAPGFNNSYTPIEIRHNAAELLKPGAKITIAVHCHQTEGGQGVDVGLANVTEEK
ncbi:MAG TPA: DUF4965 domain-containing protein [Tepidisphaeraceae bacterium]|nr:DUF4965 domain-containing protein [Tepidisphaeraceae bacterium]